MDHSTAQKTWATSNDFIVEQNIDSTENRALKEIQLALTEEAFTLKALLETAGIQVTLSPVPFSEIPKLRNGIEKALEFLENLKVRTDIVRSALEQDISLNDAKGLFWIACRKFNFKPNYDSIDLISDEDVLEIYSIANGYKQIFSNFIFWEMVSYPLDIILTKEFYEIFDRNDAITQAIIKSAEKVMLNKKTMSVEVPIHIMNEISSEKKYSFRIHTNFIGPLICRASNEITALVTTSAATRL